MARKGIFPEAKGSTKDDWENLTVKGESMCPTQAQRHRVCARVCVAYTPNRIRLLEDEPGFFIPKQI